jgi:agmatine/peptidylarginine deiminase
VLAGPVWAEWDVDGLEELIPHAESDLERQRLESSGRSPTDWLARGVDPPPLAPIRNCAEWEPVTGVLIRYPLGLPYHLLRDLDDVVTLHVVVRSSSQGSAITNFVANGVDTSAVQLLVQPNNSIWTRDYGPWFVFDGNGDIGIVDHVYNRPFRPDDNMIPVHFGAQQGIPVYSHAMWHTGGNYMTDGAHISMSTDLVYDEARNENGMSSEEVDALMLEYYGINVYNVVEDIETGGIHHIDTWGKFLDEETVLIKEVWSSHYTYGNLEQRATLIGSLLASTGRPYRVFRVYCHNMGGNQPASYTNSLLVNDRICVPTFNSSVNDSAALDAYRQAAPGRDVRGYYYSGWLTDDALHCRAKGVMDRGMLRVAHIPIVEEQQGSVTVAALVDDRSESGVAAVDLFHRFDGESWQRSVMTNVGGDDWQGVIPAPTSDTSVDYYLLASDNEGRTEGMPRVAPAHWYTFSILAGVTEAPVTSASGAPRTFPNPFRDRTRFRFELRYPDTVELAVYDVRGRLIRRLLDGQRSEGVTEVEWDGRNEVGQKVPAGVYYFRLRAAGLLHTRPVVLTK